VTLRALLVGTGLTAAILSLFWLAGPLFFLEGRRPFQLNFTAGAALGLALGLLVPRLVPGEPARAMALVAIPGLLVLAAVGSHFAVFFPRLSPGLDKVFGSLALWFYGFALIGALLVRRRR
jgi:hypothetical protein